MSKPIKESISEMPLRLKIVLNSALHIFLTFSGPLDSSADSFVKGPFMFPGVLPSGINQREHRHLYQVQA